VIRILTRARLGFAVASLIAAVGPLALAGCAPKADLDAPAVAPPPAFSVAGAPAGGPVSIRENQWPDLEWWKVFEDPQLHSLINEALRGNNDLDVAARQVEVARALVRGRRAPLLPEATLTPTVLWRRTSENANVVREARGQMTDEYALPVTVSYELDFWNKNKLALQSAQSLARASEQDWRTLHIEIVSGVASTYFNIATTLAELRVAEETLRSYEEYLKVVQRRFDVGVVSGLDVDRTKAQISATEATIPTLRLRVQELQHRLAVLLGRNPGQTVSVRPLGETRIPVELPGGLPSGLLQRRPDIRAQQERLQSAAAQVGVARALYFPDFRLDLAAGPVTATIEKLFVPESFAMAFIAQAAAPLFRGGALEANFDANVAAYKQEVAAYQQTVLVAFQETQDAIAQVQELTRQRDRLRQAVADEERSQKIANRSYEGGVSSYLEVLDAQRSLLAAQNALTQVEGQRLVSMVSLYKSLGGGWQ
jgi:NodT family efflux transporter outer membrane factor (OMF) lipoprotein